MNISQSINLNFVEYNVSNAWPYGDELMHEVKPKTQLLSKPFVEPVSTLAVEQQDELKAMLDFFDDYQKSLLKAALDEFKEESKGLSLEELGEAFYQIVSDVFDYDDSSAKLTSAYSGLVDIYI